MSKKEIYNLNGSNGKRSLDNSGESFPPGFVKSSSKKKSKAKGCLKMDGDNNFVQQKIKLSSDVIKDIHQELLEQFPAQYTVVIMDLAVHLSLLLNNNEDLIKKLNFDDIGDSFWNLDLPYSLLSNDTKSCLRSIFNHLTNAQLGSFMKSALIQIIDDNDRGKKCLGLLMLVQACVVTKPVALIANRRTLSELVNVYREQPRAVMCLVWLFRQASVNFTIASQIWLIYLVPLIVRRGYTETVLLFGEEIMNCPMDIGGNDSALLPTDIIAIIDLIFNKPTDLPSIKNNKKTVTMQLTQLHLHRLRVIYDKIKDHVFTPGAIASLKDFFGSFFIRLTTSNKEMTNELLNCLDRCLMVCVEYVQQVDHLFLNYPQQTIILISHLQSAKSHASTTMVVKHKSYKSLITKINNQTTAAATGSKQERLHQLSKTYQPSRIFSCCGTLMKVLLYGIIMAVLAVVIVRYQYPQHYSALIKKTVPVFDNVVVTVTPIVHSLQQQAMVGYKKVEPLVADISAKVTVQSRALWTVMRPYVTRISTNIEEAAVYVYGKVDEVAPHLLAKIADMYVLAWQYATDCYSDLSKYLSSPQFQALMRQTIDKGQGVLTQAHNGLNGAVTYVRGVMGY